MEEKSSSSSSSSSRNIPTGDTPYAIAKHAQVVEKDPEKAIALFLEAINSGDRVDSALKDMVVVMKQLSRTEEAIDTVNTYRAFCSKQAQSSLDNVLIDLYKKCGKRREQIVLIKQKLKLIFQGEAFNGKTTRTARSHGKKFQVSIKQEISRLLGNMGWAYMKNGEFMAAEVVYKKAQIVDADSNKACNLAYCLIKQLRYEEARSIIQGVLENRFKGSDDERWRSKAYDLLGKIELGSNPPKETTYGFDNDFMNDLDDLIEKSTSPRLKRLPIFEEIYSRGLIFEET